MKHRYIISYSGGYDYFSCIATSMKKAIDIFTEHFDKKSRPYNFKKYTINRIEKKEEIHE